MNDDVAIKVEGVHKSFKLPHESVNSLKSSIVNFWRRERGYEIQHVLKDVSFEIKKGEFFGIVGRNGSGKSTLLKLISQIYTPDKGSVQVNGRLTPFIELGVGFSPELSGRDNVYLNGALLGFNRQEMDAMYDEIVAFAELERFMDQKLKNYSSGMQVRLAFSIAIRANSDILVLDEVLAVGDEAFQKKCFEYFNQLRKEEKTVILVTHSMDAVRQYCNRAILLDSGEVVHDSADVESVADSYSKLFIKETALSFNQEDRFGTGEVVFDKIRKKVTNEKVILDFDVINKTEQTYQDVYIGVNVKCDGELVTGNHLKYANGYSEGLTLRPNAREHITMEFANILSKHEYYIDLNIRANNGTLNFDTINNAVRIPLANPRGSKFYKVQMPLSVRRGKP